MGFSCISQESFEYFYTSLLLIITLRFTYGEKKICSTIKKSGNIMNMIVGS